MNVWDADTGRPLAMLTRHTDYVNSVQFSRGSDPRILSSSDDSTVRISDCGPCLPLEQVRTRAVQLLSADGRTAAKAAVGECYGEFSPYQQPVACGSLHQDEVFALLTHPAAENDPFPSTTLDSWAQGECTGDVYRQYRGMTYDDDLDYYVWWRGPNSDEWDIGQRSVVCVLTPVDSQDRTQSARRPR
jgi:WD40 repeat protein